MHRLVVVWKFGACTEEAAILNGVKHLRDSHANVNAVVRFPCPVEAQSDGHDDTGIDMRISASTLPPAHWSVPRTRRCQSGRFGAGGRDRRGAEAVENFRKPSQRVSRGQ